MNRVVRLRALTRWIAVLPGAAAAAVLADMAMRLFDWVGSMVGGINPNEFFDRLGSEAMEGAVIGAAFVYAGSRIAPTQRKLVSYVLTVIVIALTSFVGFRAILQKDWWALEACIAIAAGATILVAYVVATDCEKSLKSLQPSHPSTLTAYERARMSFRKTLRKRLTLGGAEAKYAVQIDELGANPIPFGYMNKEWCDLVAQMIDGDELWELQQPDGDQGIALMRSGELVTIMFTSIT